MNILSFFLTAIVAVVGGFLGKKIKRLPAGDMIGAMVCVTALNIATGMAYLPRDTKVLAQLIAGCFIGLTFDLAQVRTLKAKLKPLCIMLGGMFILAAIIGTTVYWVSGMDLMTSLLACTPGGMTNISIIAVDMTPHASKVAIMQFFRSTIALSCFPVFAHFVIRRIFHYQQQGQVHTQTKPEPMVWDKTAYLNMAATIAASIALGLLGNVTGLPGGTLVGAMLGIILLKLLHRPTQLPAWVRTAGKIIAGAYLGTRFGMQDVLELRLIILPTLILVVGYFLGSIALGAILHKTCKMDIATATLVSTPAGAGEMAFLAMDMGGVASDVAIFHIIRLIVVVSVCPGLISLIVGLVGG